MNREGKQIDVNRFLIANNVGLFGLLGTKINPTRVPTVVNKVFSEWSMSTNSTYHKGGRVWVLWEPNMVDVQFLDYNAQYIHLHVTDKETHEHITITFVYAFNGVTEREPLWGNLKRLAGSTQGPWVIGDDFNCVTQASDRLGGTFSDAEAEPFQQCLEEYEVMDIQSTGAYYTWNNKQPPETIVYSKLDRLFVNHEWSLKFLDFYANFLPEGYFDHTPCLVGKISKGHYKNRPFKYYNMWSAAPGFHECARTHYSDVENKADIASVTLHQLQQQLALKPGDGDLIRQEYNTNQLSKSLQQAKLLFLKQKAKAHWIAEGDANSSYFHGVLRARRNRNFIQEIKDYRDRLYTDEEGIQKAFLDFYEILLGTKSSTQRVNNSIVKNGSICSTDHKKSLMIPVTKEEIKETIFHIPNDKSPGPDGYFSKFFKDTWDIVGGGNDLLLFCKGDVHSMMIILRTFSTFSISSGLKMSRGKSNAYFNGVRESIKHEIMQVSGLVEGALPFRYLGVPIKTTRLSAVDWRLVLVKAILNTLHTYWASMFILPNGLIHRIEAICRNFIWDGGTEYTKVHLVSWDTICKPKEEEGLGIKDDIIWNKAAVGKLVWWITSKAYHLWVKWVNHTYIKNKDWHTYSPPASSSWYWRKVCQVKEAFTAAYQQNQWSDSPENEYTIARGYDLLRDKDEKINWHNMVWNKLTIPKHGFMAWIYQHKNMNTNEKLYKLGISTDDTCYICGYQTETMDHLFFTCDYSKEVIKIVGQWIGIMLPIQNFREWNLRRGQSKIRIDVINAVFNACIYHTWSQ
ncbi:uncharacterized protein LOC141639159 [Silene latifolia]|uniref:uncharacterized protein LOC141639159 n=1 Tax=Silene latifolia TaxID=37657 RepID=UPI003D77A652